MFIGAIAKLIRLSLKKGTMESTQAGQCSESAWPGPQPGHVGHGIGRDHYEEPIIAPTRHELLQDGSVIVLEPGRYGDGRGIRIEHAFRVSVDGGQLLSSFPLDL